jgi:hypothetical protein
VTHGKGTIQILLNNSGELLRGRTEGVAEFLEEWLADAVDFETVWDLSFGRALRALESDEVDPVDALVEVALRVGARGHSGRWRATLSDDLRLRWDTRWLLPAACEIAFLRDDAGGVCLELQNRNSESLGIGLTREGELSPNGAAEPIVRVGATQPIALLPEYAVPHDMIVEDDFHSIFEFPPITETIFQPFGAALKILEYHAPEYLEWVNGVLRGVLVCSCTDSRTRSSSWMHAPGIVLASWSTNPITIAEMLVHESSHQYFHLLSRMGDVDDGTDVREYFSPAVQRNRPLSRILIGYHAFANVLLLYQSLLRNGLAEDPYCRAMERRLCADVGALELPLHDNPALTDIGRDLIRPLAEQLDQSRRSDLSI